MKAFFATIAISIIASFRLRVSCDNRIMALMDTAACNIIDGLGGTTAVHKLTGVPISTIHSWRKNGIPDGRLNHLKLAAQAAGRTVCFDQHGADHRSAA